MNASPHLASSAASSDSPATLDERNPWLGLASFTEETRSFFFGRDEEVAELARRVQRKLLTVLFGKSGLGKTSILRAGLVPRLREHGYCPVYVRIAYGHETPEPAEQIKEAIRRAASFSGSWSQAGVATVGESLWEFLHHRDDVLRDASGTTVIPLLIFDQFEELFTLAQSDDFGRARAARFVEELADLVENRPPKALEALIEQDEDAAERFDFARTDYRVLIALREDYLAPLESLKKVMPSLLQNRLRLAPMTGAQALEAVLRPGRGLVSQEVAEAIVRFVAGGAERANAEVEPSLLSLICRELNDARLAQGRDEISLDLLAGSHESILTGFYERSLADQPAAVRRIIEDELLTDSGFRENVAEETLLKRFDAVDAAPGALATLVNRRLLRIEERLDVRRVELTHDVLCGVVKSSRDQRHEREAREAAERVLAEQRAREQAARRALRRVQAVAVGCVLLAALALSAAVLAYRSAERAQRAERLAQQSRALAEQARSHAEQLLGYLADDFERELESFGQLSLLAQFTQRQIDYLHALPLELRSAETARNGALALIEHAQTVRYLGDYATGMKNTDEAIQLLESLHRGGDASQATLVALGRAYMTRCLMFGTRNAAYAIDTCRHAAAILQPLADKPGASLPARRAYLETLMWLGWADQYAGDYEGSERAEQQSMQIASALGAQSLGSLQISADYAEAGSNRVNALANLGRDDQASRVGKEALAVADGVLERRPWYRFTLMAKAITETEMATAAEDELDPREELTRSLQGQQTGLALLRLDPNNRIELFDVGLSLTYACQALWARGRLDQAIAACRNSLGPLGNGSAGSGGDRAVFGFFTVQMAHRQALSGDLSGAMNTPSAAEHLLDPTHEPPGTGESLAVELDAQVAQSDALYERGDFAAASRLAARAIQRAGDARPATASRKLEQQFERPYLLFYLSNIDGRAEYRLGHFTVAERAERTALAQGKTIVLLATSEVTGKRDLGEASIWLSLALARQGKLGEAAQVISPVVGFEQSLLARDHGDVWISYELACALYAQSLSEPARRATLLRRAAALLDSLPPRLRRMRGVRQWRQWVSQ